MRGSTKIPTTQTVYINFVDDGEGDRYEAQQGAAHTTLTFPVDDEEGGQGTVIPHPQTAHIQFPLTTKKTADARLDEDPHPTDRGEWCGDKRASKKEAGAYYSYVTAS